MKINRGKVMIFTVAVLLVGTFAYARNVTKQNKILGSQIEALKNDPQSASREEIKKLTEMLSKLVILPDGEEPVVATVTDKEKLKDQPVFAKAENGDKILIYAKAAKAYIYRPTNNLLIDVVPVNIGNQQLAITGVDENNPLEVALVNGSKNSGITNDLEKRINDTKIPGLKVVSKAVAKSDNYEKTLVIDVSGKHSQQAKEMAALVSGIVATESGEINAKADLMIILGADFK